MRARRATIGQHVVAILVHAIRERIARRHRVLCARVRRVCARALSDSRLSVCERGAERRRASSRVAWFDDDCVD